MWGCTQHDVRFWKNPHWAKMVSNGPQVGLFKNLGKSSHQFCREIF